MRSSREADDVPIMTCVDARDGLSVLSRDGMGLTEWVLADAHVRKCGACREALENFQPLVSSGPRVAQHRVVLRWLTARIDAIRSGITRVATCVTRIIVLLAISLTALGLNVTRAINANRIGAMWVVDQLDHVRLSSIWELCVRPAARVVVSTRLAMTRVAGILGWFRSSSLSVTRAAAGGIEVVRAAGSRPLGFLIQVGVLLPTLMVVSVRAAARLIGDVLMGCAHRLTWCRSLLGDVSHWAAEAAIRAWCSGTRLVDRSSANAAGTTRVVIALTGRNIAVGRARARRVVALCRPADLTIFLALPQQAATRGIETTWVIGRMVLTRSGHAVRRLALSARVGPVAHLIDGSVSLKVMRWSLWANRRALYTGGVCLGVLIAAILFLWPQWSAHVLFQSMPQRLAQPHRQSTDPRPADLGTAKPLAEPLIADISLLRPAPALQPKTRRVAVPPSRPEAAIPTPTRRREPAAARESASAPVSTPLDGPWAREPLRTPQTGVQHAEAPDASAAIDWLVNRGRESSRLSIESP